MTSTNEWYHKRKPKLVPRNVADKPNASGASTNEWYPKWIPQSKPRTGGYELKDSVTSTNEWQSQWTSNTWYGNGTVDQPRKGKDRWPQGPEEAAFEVKQSNPLSKTQETTRTVAEDDDNPYVLTFVQRSDRSSTSTWPDTWTPPRDREKKNDGHAAPKQAEENEADIPYVAPSAQGGEWTIWEENASLKPTEKNGPDDAHVEASVRGRKWPSWDDNAVPEQKEGTTEAAFEVQQSNPLSKTQETLKTGVEVDDNPYILKFVRRSDRSSTSTWPDTWTPPRDREKKNDGHAAPKQTEANEADIPYAVPSAQGGEWATWEENASLKPKEENGPDNAYVEASVRGRKWPSWEDKAVPEQTEGNGEAAVEVKQSNPLSKTQETPRNVDDNPYVLTFVQRSDRNTSTWPDTWTPSPDRDKKNLEQSSASTARGGQRRNVRANGRRGQQIRWINKQPRQGWTENGWNEEQYPRWSYQRPAGRPGRRRGI